MEEAKRLDPKASTARILFAKSGNQCAFRGCFNSLVSDSGVYIGNICHIEAALPDGPRFNLNMTNEQRREPNNLLIMCYEHHKETDDVEKYPVSVLKQIKQEHEDKFKNLINDLASQLYEDITDSNTGVQATTLILFNSVMNWNSNQQELS
ncbi:hypothetical protein ABC345_20085 [Shouchella sp. 1P09AA]|uniref:hypothetical protein n=1 Tax=unclassified Shouchella TaxID=2893065 RepID=UPI00399F8AB3